MTGFSIEVGGLSGSGKTTISKRLAENLGFPHVDFANLLLEAAGYETVASEHDRIITWTPRVLNDTVLKAQDTLIRRSRSAGKYVLETHVSPRIEGEGYRPTPPEPFRARQPIGLILVHASYEDLLNLRQARGMTRDSVQLDQDLFEMDWNATLSAGITLASAANVPCHVIRNRFGKLESAVAEAIAVARRMVENRF